MPRIGTVLGVFSLLGVLLAMLGLYGVVTHSVTQRTSEIGIRMALGARRTQVLGMILNQGIRLVLVGAFFGSAASWIITRSFAAMLPTLPQTRLATVGWMTILMLAIALLACVIPAHRASRIDPMKVLRQE
jgi:putative ABC transport system permease protein